MEKFLMDFKVYLWISFVFLSVTHGDDSKTCQTLEVIRKYANADGLYELSSETCPYNNMMKYYIRTVAYEDVPDDPYYLYPLTTGHWAVYITNCSSSHYGITPEATSYPWTQRFEESDVSSITCIDYFQNTTHTSTDTEGQLAVPSLNVFRATVGQYRWKVILPQWTHMVSISITVVCNDGITDIKIYRLDHSDEVISEMCDGRSDLSPDFGSDIIPVSFNENQDDTKGFWLHANLTLDHYSPPQLEVSYKITRYGDMLTTSPTAVFPEDVQTQELSSVEEEMFTGVQQETGIVIEVQPFTVKSWTVGNDQKPSTDDQSTGSIYTTEQDSTDISINSTRDTTDEAIDVHPYTPSNVNQTVNVYPQYSVTNNPETVQNVTQSMDVQDNNTTLTSWEEMAFQTTVDGSLLSTNPPISSKFPSRVPGNESSDPELTTDSTKYTGLPKLPDIVSVDPDTDNTTEIGLTTSDPEGDDHNTTDYPITDAGYQVTTKLDEFSNATEGDTTNMMNTTQYAIQLSSADPSEEQNMTNIYDPTAENSTDFSNQQTYQWTGGTTEVNSIDGTTPVPDNQTLGVTEQTDQDPLTTPHAGTGLFEEDTTFPNFQNASSEHPAVIPVVCMPGLYLDESSGSCTPCPIGTYQPNSGSVSCLPCAKSYATDTTGSVEPSSCKFFCPPGFQTETNGEHKVCVGCQNNMYKDNRDSVLERCKNCPHGKITLEENTTSEADCIKDLCLTVTCHPNAKCFLGECQCPPLSSCSHHVQPVCATDGVTYSSPCDMKAHMCLKNSTLEVKSEGDCPQDVPDVCTDINCPCGSTCTPPGGVCECIDDASQICASDNTTYKSLCDMMKTACDQDIKLTMRYGIPCENVTKMPDVAVGGSTEKKEVNIVYIFGGVVGFICLLVLVIVVSVLVRRRNKHQTNASGDEEHVLLTSGRPSTRSTSSGSHPRVKLEPRQQGDIDVDLLAGCITPLEEHPAFIFDIPEPQTTNQQNGFAETCINNKAHRQTTNGVTEADNSPNLDDVFFSDHSVNTRL